MLIGNISLKMDLAKITPAYLFQSIVSPAAKKEMPYEYVLC
jgi:hypothetical protein